MNKPTRSRVDCFVFPLEPDAKELLTAWQIHHRPEFARIRASFLELRFALDNKCPGPEAAKLRRVLTYWEGIMLAAYDKTTYVLVPTLTEGYGTPTTIHDYKATTDSLPLYSKNYRRLRDCFNKLIKL